MVKLAGDLKAILKKPLGQAGPLPKLLPLAEGKRIIAVGDQVVFALLSRGIRPHVAVFDFRTMRTEVARGVRERISKEYPSPQRVANAPGTISEALFLLAPVLISEGGALRIDGEEDLAAFPFILLLDEKSVVIYGQPGEGCVLVDNEGDGKKLVKRIAGKLGLASLSD